MDEPELRIGDVERRETDARLRRALDEGRLHLDEYDERAAACYAARTRSELDVLTRDLPAPGPVAPAAPAPAAPRPARRSGHGRSHRLGGRALALALGGAALFLVGRVVTADDGAAVFGSRVVEVAPGDDRVEVGALFGSVRVVVPDGVPAGTDGWVVFGSVECAAACAPGTGPGLVVDARGAFGSVQVVTPAELAREQAEDAREDREDQREDRDD